MSINVEITDKWGDKLVLGSHVDPGDEFIYVNVADEFEIEIDQEQARQLRDGFNAFLLEDETPPITGATPSLVSPNEAKLGLAAAIGLRAKFSYRGERDYRAVERRLVPDTVFENKGVLYVGGESHDAGGQPEGYRQFRLDRISGEVVVR